MPRNVRDRSTPPAPWSGRAWLAIPVCVAFLVSAPTRAQVPSLAPDPAQVSTLLEQKYDSGAARALAPAQACYRSALDGIAAGRRDEAVRLLNAATEFDPLYPDPHFTLSRVLLPGEPGRALSEFAEGFRILGRSYTWQRHLLANLLTALLVVWFLSLLFAIAGIVFRHLKHLLHILGELLGPRLDRLARIGAALLAAGPALWLLGIVPTAAIYTGFLSFRLGRRDGALVVLFFATALLLAGGLPFLAPWAGAPTLDDPSLLVSRAMRSAYDPDLAAALQASAAADPSEPLYPFALGTLARRGGDLDLAERELTQATLLRANTTWALVNLGNVAFAREDYARARDLYDRAARISPGAVEPHYNLAQVYTKELLFAEASREQSTATALAFDRVRDMSRISAPQLNRTVMDAAPSLETLWDLARRTAPARADVALAGNRWLMFLDGLGPKGPFATILLPALFLVFAGVGQILARRLQTIHCSNCQKVVCRRCVHRMQQRAFCRECYESVKDLKSVEFTRLLLTRRDRKAARRRTIGEAVVTFLLPGAGHMLRGASLVGFAAILIMVAAGTLVLSNGALVPSAEVLPYSSGQWMKRIPLLLLFAITYALTVARYFSATTTRVPTLAAGRAGVARRREAAPAARARGGGA